MADAITGHELDTMLGGTYGGVHGEGTTYATRAARSLGLPRLGSGNRRTFTLGQTVAALAASELAGAPHQLARDLVYAHVPAVVDRYGPPFVIVACSAGSDPWLAWGDEDAVVAAAAAHRDCATLVHVMDVGATLATIERTRAVTS